MRRLWLPALCGSLMLLLPGATPSAEAAPNKRARAAAPAAGAKRAEPKPAEPRAGEPTGESAKPRRLAPRPREYKLAEPSPEVKLKAKGIRKSGNALMISGYVVSGVGLAGTIAGAVLISIANGSKAQTAGTISLISGAALLATGATLWAIGRWRSNKAEVLLIKARMRQVQLRDPSKVRHNQARALALPKTKSVFSAQLRF